MKTSELPLAFKIKSLDNQIKRLLNRSAIEKNEANLTGMQYAVLGFLHEQDEAAGVYQREVEAEFNIRRSTASEMLKSLEREGYIVRTSDTVDTRLKRILMTPKAKELNDDIIEKMKMLQQRLTKDIPAEELEQFFRTLEKIANNAQE